MCHWVDKDFPFYYTCVHGESDTPALLQRQFKNSITSRKNVHKQATVGSLIIDCRFQIPDPGSRKPETGAKTETRKPENQNPQKGKRQEHVSRC